MTDSVFHKIFLITCTGFRLRQRHQTAVLHLNLWKLPHGRYIPAKHHVSEVHLIGYASYFNNKSNLSSKLISRSKKLTSEQANWIFLKNYLGILRPGSNCSQVWHLRSLLYRLWSLVLWLSVCHCRKQFSLTHQTVAFFAQNLGNSCGIHLLSSSATFSQNRLFPTKQRDKSERSIRDIVVYR